MKLRKITAAAAAAAMIFAASSCGSPKASGLSFGAEIGYPPFEYYDTDGKTPIGVDIEIAKALGEKMGVEIKPVNTAWDGIFAGLDKGDYDMIISAVTITPDRLVNYDFSDPYIENYQAIVVLKDSEKKPASPDELDGLKVGYQDETTSDFYFNDYATAHGIIMETFEYAQVLDAYNDLENKRVDAVLCDSTVASSYLGNGSKFELSWIQDSDPEQFGICVKKGNNELKEKLNKALAEIQADGTLDKILNKYF